MYKYNDPKWQTVSRMNGSNHDATLSALIAEKLDDQFNLLQSGPGEPREGVRAPGVQEDLNDTDDIDDADNPDESDDEEAEKSERHEAVLSDDGINQKE